MSTSVRILCARCKSPVHVPVRPRPVDLISCPVCRVRDSFESVRDQLRRYKRERLARKLDARMRAALRDSGSLEYFPEIFPEGTYHFIPDD